MNKLSLAKFKFYYRRIRPTALILTEREALLMHSLINEGIDEKRVAEIIASMKD